jgi:hypothetical protein
VVLPQPTLDAVIEGVYDNSGLWRNRPSPRQISNKMKKISYEPHRNLLLSKIVKNLLR